MILVLDASAAIEIALNKSDSKRFKEKLDEADLIIAPDTYPSEITSVFWKYADFSGLSTDQCEDGVDCCIDFETKGFCREVFLESKKARHSPYDMYYVVLARRNGAALLTKDKKLKSIAKEFKIKILN